MNILAYGIEADNTGKFLEINDLVGKANITFAKGVFSLEDESILDNIEAISILTNSYIGEKEAKLLSEKGVKYVLTRSVGTEHIDYNSLRKYKIKAANIPSYSPNAISEHTIMLLLSILRKMKLGQKMIREHNFGTGSICAREVRMMTVGVVGAGRIGSLTIKALNGLGAKVIYVERKEKVEVSKYAELVNMEELYARADMIVLHCPLTSDNYHMINKETLKKCKNGVVIINTSRGGLVDIEDILEALDEGKVSGYGVDVYEDENAFIRKDFDGKKTSDELFEKLIQKDNVIYTPHIGFYTDEALYEMLKISLENAYEYEIKDRCKNEIVV